jgi:carbamoyltransferase
VTWILGISAFYHDSAAALIRDGEIVAAAQEERFSRLKHDHHFPSQAIQSCLDIGGCSPADLAYIVFYDKPLLKFDRLLETYLTYAPAGIRSFLKAMPLWLKQKLHLHREIRQGLAGPTPAKILFTEHHEAHAAAAFFPSPFDEAALITLDGVGEWATASYGRGRQNQIELLAEMRFPHSLGLLYSAFTYYCGFKVNSGEYKLMGLAPYGQPRYQELIFRHLLDLKEDGSFRLDLDYFNYCQGLTMTNRRFDRLFGAPPRRAEAALEQHHMDIAASIQAVTEEIILRLARHVRRETGLRNLCLSGGVALNCVANGRLLRAGIFDRLWIQPAAGDAGSAVGAALFAWHQLLEQPRQADNTHDTQQASLLGPAYTSDHVCRALEARGAVYERYPQEAPLLLETARLIAAGCVVGWFQGRMEFGPRALGCRSILGDARDPQTQARMNLKIKFRESFRPFAPAVLMDHVHELFELQEESPYMLLVAPVREAQRRPLTDDERQTMATDPDLRHRVNIPRSDVPAVTHVDYSARVQTVDAERHGRFYRLLQAFRQLTGQPLLVNTSFNIRGEPIVCTPEDAYRCFLLTDMDALVIEDVLLLKDRQPPASLAERDAYAASFAPD